jgi:hypothetical protein
LASCDFVVVTDAITIGVVVNDGSALTGFTNSISVDTGFVGVRGGLIVVAGRGIGTTGHFVGVADAIVVVVVVDDGSSHAGFTDAIRVGTRSVRVGGGSVVVACGVVLATGDFVVIANTVIIGIIVDNSSGTIGGSRAGVTGVGRERAASIGIGGGNVVVASGIVLATGDFIVITHTVIIGIIVDYSSGTIGGSRAGVARVNGVGAASVGIGGGAVVVACGVVLATGDFIGIADPIIV